MEKETRRAKEGILRLAFLLVSTAAVSSGCATLGRSSSKCFEYPRQNFKVCEASPAFVNRVCDQGEASDEGYMIANPKRFLGCADHANRVAWVAWDAPEPETTIHEICHMLENKPEDCEKIRGSSPDFADPRLIASRTR